MHGEAWCRVSLDAGAGGSLPPPLTPQAEHYLPNSLGSTVRGFESGEGRSPHNLSSCSSLSHLPGGRNNFTETPLATPVPTSPSHSTLPAPQKKGQCCELARTWPKGHHNEAGRCQSSPKENQLLGRGGLSLPESLPIPQRGKVRAGVWSPQLPVPSPSSQGCATTPSKFSQHFPETLAHPKPTEYNETLFL